MQCTEAAESHALHDQPRPLRRFQPVLARSPVESDQRTQVDPLTSKLINLRKLVANHGGRVRVGDSNSTKPEPSSSLLLLSSLELSDTNVCEP